MLTVADIVVRYKEVETLTDMSSVEVAAALTLIHK